MEAGASTDAVDSDSYDPSKGANLSRTASDSAELVWVEEVEEADSELQSTYSEPALYELGEPLGSMRATLDGEDSPLFGCSTSASEESKSNSKLRVAYLLKRPVGRPRGSTGRRTAARKLAIRNLLDGRPSRVRAVASAADREPAYSAVPPVLEFVD